MLTEQYLYRKKKKNYHRMQIIIAQKLLYTLFKKNIQKRNKWFYWLLHMKGQI